MIIARLYDPSEDAYLAMYRNTSYQRYKAKVYLNSSGVPQINETSMGGSDPSVGTAPNGFYNPSTQDLVFCDFDSQLRYNIVDLSGSTPTFGSQQTNTTGFNGGTNWIL